MIHDLKVERVAIASLRTYHRNPRRGQVDVIAASLRVNGQYKPLTVNVGTHTGRPREVLAGNHTLAAARDEGWAEIAVVWVDVDNDQAARIVTADNRTADLAEYDDQLLVDLLADLPDLDGTGYTAAELDALTSELGGNVSGNSGNLPDGGSAPAPSLTDRFLSPPFTVLDSRQGYWQDRKRRWIAAGIDSGDGREHVPLYGASGRSDPVSAMINEVRGGPSIFDPVLAELAVRWFSPASGHVLDPFAGGSVRGIVAALCGRSYHGVDIRPEQVDANRGQAEQVLVPAPIPVKVSAASARQKFHGCTPDYIANVCHGACCRSTTQPTGIMVTIHPSEQAAVEAAGGTVVGGLLQAVDRSCPFQGRNDHLCGLHDSDTKPFGCIASPFTLNDNDTLVVRNRYRRLGCYNDDRDGPPLPAYKAFRASLNLIFGEGPASELCEHLDNGGGDTVVNITPEIHRKLHENDAIKRGIIPTGAEGSATWTTGDAAAILPTLPDAHTDLIFTCPPYYDLERYSDDPADLSTMNTDAFDATYARILTECARCLRENRFAVVVTGNVRDSNGHIRDLRALTASVFSAAGMSMVNDAILVNSSGSAALRAAGAFTSNRTLTRVHQEVLVFVKGSRNQAARACEEIAFVDLANTDSVDHPVPASPERA